MNFVRFLVLALTLITATVNISLGASKRKHAGNVSTQTNKLRKIEPKQTCHRSSVSIECDDSEADEKAAVKLSLQSSKSDDKKQSSFALFGIEELLSPANKEVIRNELKTLDAFFNNFYAQKDAYGENKNFNTICLEQQQNGNAGPSDLKNFPTLNKLLTMILQVLCQKANMGVPTILLDQGYRCSSTHGHETKKHQDAIALGCQTIKTFLIDCSPDEQEISFKSFIFLVGHECGHLNSDKDRAFNCASNGPDGADKAKCLREFELAADKFGATLCNKIFPNFTQRDACHGLNLIGKIAAEGLKKELTDQEIKSYLEDDRKLVEVALNPQKYKIRGIKKREQLDLALQIQCADKATYTCNCDRDEEIAHQLKNQYPTGFVRSKKIATLLYKHP